MTVKKTNKELRELLNELVDQELNWSQEQFQKHFHSHHEAYAVIKEEHEEVGEELDSISYYMDRMWDDVKDIKDITQVNTDILKKIKHRSESLFIELIQLLAMTKKYELSVLEARKEQEY